ncbi:MAG: PspC domain-containing protein [Candidatus Izemoplasma sp.]|nr:PspC domain-containing protein [Candidatus Izemoplasma sp.]
MSSQKRLYKNGEEAVIAGVCQGIAEYIDVDVTIVRLLTVFIAIFTSGVPVVLIYIIMAIVLPEKKELGYTNAKPKKRQDAFKKDNEFDLNEDDFTIDEKDYYE